MNQKENYSNKITHQLITEKLSSKTPIDKKRLYISKAIKNITNTDLLNDIIFKLAKTNLLNFNNEYILKFRKELKECNYLEDVNTQIRSEFLSIFLDYDTRVNYFHDLTQLEKPKLTFKIRRKQLIHNYDAIFKILKKESSIFHFNKIKKLPLDQQKNAYKKIIKETTLFQYSNDSKEFKKELKLFNTLKENIEIEEEKTKDKNNNLELEYPFIVLDAKELFLEYVSKHIIEPYVDYSYLFQRLLYQKIISHITHFQFINWLAENNHITESTKNIFLTKESFRSLKKSTSVNRENNFNTIFKSILSAS